MYAAMENKLSMVDRMLDLGCDINAKNKVISPSKRKQRKVFNIHNMQERYTTLHLASMYSREDTIKLLLQRRADPSTPGGVRGHSFPTPEVQLENCPQLTIHGEKNFPFFSQPKNQSCVHLVCSRPTSQALQILRALLGVAPKNARINTDAVSKKKIKKNSISGSRGLGQCFSHAQRNGEKEFMESGIVSASVGRMILYPK